MKDNEFKQTWDGNFKNFNLSEKEIGYLAGFLDADGSISISIRKNTEGYFFKEISIIFENTNEEAINFIKGKLPCYIRIDKRPKHLGTKPVFILRIKGVVNQLSILKLLEPLLIVKREKALEAIKLLEKDLD